MGMLMAIAFLAHRYLSEKKKVLFNIRHFAERGQTLYHQTTSKHYLQARSARAINRREKTRIRNLQYGPRNEVIKIFIISLRLIGRAKKEFSKLVGRTVKCRPRN